MHSFLWNNKSGGETIRYPFIKQREEKDCGITCLQMILAYYHSYVPKEELRQITHTTKRGTSAYGLLQGAEQLGFRVRALKGDFQALQVEQLVYPVIAHVVKEGIYYHYVLIYKMDHKHQRILIADPSTRLSWVTFQSFQMEWNNIVLVLEPMIQLRNERKASVFELCYQIIERYRKEVIVLFFFALIQMILSLIISYYFKVTVDFISNLGTKLEFYLVSIFFLFFFILHGLSSVFHSDVILKWSTALDLSFTKDIFQKLVSLPYDKFHRRSTGEIMTYFQELMQLKDILITFVSSILLDILFCIGALLLLSTISLSLFSLCLFMICLYGMIFALCKRCYQIYMPLVKREQGNVSHWLIESVRGYETVKGSHLEHVLNSFFGRYHYRFEKEAYHLKQLERREQIGEQLLLESVRFLFIFLGGIMMLKRNLTIASFVFAYMLFDYVISPMRTFCHFFLEWIQVRTAICELSFLWKEKKERNKIVLSGIQTIEFRHLCYAYEEDTLVLKNIDIILKEKEHVMLFGPSGSGKSTIFQLLMKFYQAKENSIFINAIDYHQYERESFLRHLCYISQKETLFTTNLYENITLARKISQSEFLKVCHVCQLDFIDQFKGGYYMLVEENGKNLSGGQCQRIILARALLLPCEFLIIDEGLNQIEVTLERQILQDVMRYYPEKTIIYITHRYRNFDLFSRLLYMKHGRILKDWYRKGEKLVD